MPGSTERGRVYLHVGLPKSGTTYLQGILALNRRGLRRAGYLYPNIRGASMFRAAVEIRGSHAFWGFTEGQVAGSWARVCRAARSFDGAAILSHEILAGATPEQVARAAEELAGLDVHVVVTARDLGRQIAAVWQEGVKNGQTRAFGRYASRLLDDMETGRQDMGFWNSQDLPQVMQRWGSITSPDKVHLVTTPPPGGDRLELWRRFAGAVGFDPDAFSTETRRTNESLGTAQIALLRDVNKALDGRLVQPGYSRVVKRYFAQQVLAGGPAGRRATLPPELYPPVRDLSEGWLEQIEGAGYVVHGDLGDLLPLAPAEDSPPPDEVADAEKCEVAAAAIAELLREVDRLRRDADVGSSDRARPVHPWWRRGLRRIRGLRPRRPARTS